MGWMEKAERKKKIDVRGLKRRAYNSSKKKPLPSTAFEQAEGQRLLKEAKQDKINRGIESDKDIANYAYEAAGYVRNRARGSVMIVPCISESFRKNYDLIKWG